MKALLRCLLSLLVLTAHGCAGQPREEVPLFSQAELDQMLAPIALYPDQLLSQVLMAATYPLEVVQAARWSREHPGLQGQEAVRAVDDRAWDPSVKSLVAFPDLLAQMDADLDWTERLGDAFLAQQQQLMDTVQSLRQRAYDAGNLRSAQQVQVVREREVIYVRSAYPDVIYMPYYDPFTIYGSWWWPHYRPVYWAPWPSYGVTCAWSSTRPSITADRRTCSTSGCTTTITAAACPTATRRSSAASCRPTPRRCAATTTATSVTATATTATARTMTVAVNARVRRRPPEASRRAAASNPASSPPSRVRTP